MTRDAMQAALRAAVTIALDEVLGPDFPKHDTEVVDVHHDAETDEYRITAIVSGSALASAGKRMAEK